MEENTQKFLERMKELVALGKKKKSVLEIQEINDFFNDIIWKQTISMCCGSAVMQMMTPT